MTDDAELRARSDADSFAEFYRRHGRRLAGWLMRMTGDAEVVADLTAETFAAALVGRKRYDPDRGAPAGWLYGIAAHKLNEWRRRGTVEDRARLRLRMERIQLSDEDFAEFERLGSEVSLVEMLEELPDDQREPLRAAGVDDDFYLVQPHLSGRAAGSTGSTTTATRGAAATSCCRADAWGVAEGSSRNSTHG